MRADYQNRQLQRQLLRAYEHTGRRLLILGIGLLGVLGVAVIAPAAYASWYQSNLVVVGAVGSMSVAGLFFGLSATLKQVARILEARNRNPAMAYYSEPQVDRVSGARGTQISRNAARKRTIQRRTAAR